MPGLASGHGDGLVGRGTSFWASAWGTDFARPGRARVLGNFQGPSAVPAFSAGANGSRRAANGPQATGDAPYGI